MKKRKVQETGPGIFEVTLEVHVFAPNEEKAIGEVLGYFQNAAAMIVNPKVKRLPIELGAQSQCIH